MGSLPNTTEPSREELLHALRTYFGFHTFRGKQEQAIRSILAGRNTFVLMPTGGGKSLCYQLPALMRDGLVIVISPLIALMKNQVDLIRAYHTRADVAHFLNSTLTTKQREEVIQRVLAGQTKLLYLAPETLAKEETIELLRQTHIQFVAVDEAHCISEWGHDFRPEYRRIRPMLDEIQPDLPIMALTATATPKVRQDIVKNLRMKDPVFIIDSFNRPNLYYEIRQRPPKEQLLKEIIQFIRSRPGEPGIIYCLYRKTTEEVAAYLKANGIRAEAYHAGLPSKTRAKRQDQFIQDQIQVIVATIAFGLGIDKPNVRFIIHYDFPRSLESYFQETGRAGRDGLPAICIAYFNYASLVRQEQMLREKTAQEREVGYMFLEEVVSFVESGICRRKFLLHYFGEDYPKDRCDNCDNCVNPPELIPVQKDMQLLLQVVQTIGNKFHASHIVRLLRGVNDYAIKHYQHDQLPFYGKGKHQSAHFWHALIRKALMEELLEKEIERYGVLHLTPKGKQYIQKPYPIYMPEPRQFEDLPEAILLTSRAEDRVLDPLLLEHLKQIRRRVAQQHGVPPHVVFQDNTLEEMANLYPMTIQELLTLTGVNDVRAQRFGPPFLEFIRKYVEENDIERPHDFFKLRKPPQRSQKRRRLLQMIDKQIPLEEIATQMGMSVIQVLKELGRIALSGNVINIVPYIERMMEPEDYEEIKEYFLSQDEPDIDVAIEELNKPYLSEELIYLVWIKLLSDANADPSQIREPFLGTSVS